MRVFKKIAKLLCGDVKVKSRRPSRVYYVEDDKATSEGHTISTITHHIGTLSTTKTNDSKILNQLFATTNINGKSTAKLCIMEQSCSPYAMPTQMQ